MKTRYIKLFVCICFGLQLLVLSGISAQSTTKTPSQVKAETEFLTYLNKIVKQYDKNEFSLDLGKTYKPFTIDKNGMLTVTRLFTDRDDATKTFLIKESVSLDKTESVFFDYYIGFVAYDNHSVIEEKAENSKSSFKRVGDKGLLHVAPVGDGEHGYDIQKKMTKLLEKVKPFYKNK